MLVICAYQLVKIGKNKQKRDFLEVNVKKYLPDEKSVEIKNADGETFKTDGKWTVEFMNATPKD